MLHFLYQKIDRTYKVPLHLGGQKSFDGFRLRGNVPLEKSRFSAAPGPEGLPQRCPQGVYFLGFSPNTNAAAIPHGHRQGTFLHQDLTQQPQLTGLQLGIVVEGQSLSGIAFGNGGEDLPLKAYQPELQVTQLLIDLLSRLAGL